ncbi:lipase/acyltransferase domain-containing protein [Aphanothece sacrum]|uniref:Lecithin:cholesterol acyltransferase n=1 Tax=Aphanothece sacrum FPU1 TaxID=1920663 RepID=A0A401IHQ8_APHSA|nr:hypothetical protein [Aphanothece sacrum]GBF80823.1 lecithin:cholesterol acyltransferase [Aphanothece sacrum FPU1]GBF83318.1 lecithin:cholesterol acyltransferase [Aphanothece sacrum FPU3]
MVTSSPAESSTLVFFVPGIMGSSLIIRQNPSSDHDKEIWGEDLLCNIRTLREKPGLLAIQENKPVDAVKVIERFNNFTADWANIYGSLFDFLITPTGEKGLGLISENLGSSKHPEPNFFPFAYDWRKDNQESANFLADFIKEKDKNGDRRLRFIVHSMGGIVTRLMLLDNPDIAQRTDLLFQIASPLLGSAKAYSILKQGLKFNDNFILDWVYNMLQPSKKRAEFCQSIMTFPSIYQLLPPPEIKSLCDRNGKLYSALDDSIWPTNVREYLENARNVHQRLKQSQYLDQNQINIRCVYSMSHLTPTLYLVEPMANFNVITQVPSNMYGDNTVTFESAIAYSISSPENQIDSNPCDHMGLCRNETVYNILRMEFN